MGRRLSERAEMGQRPYSIRTRIKTENQESLCGTGACQRPYSIRTRIKTVNLLHLARPDHVRDHIPLEQGLRPGSPASPSTLRFSVRDHIPLEQGLRPAQSSPSWYSTRVRDHIPLEQGLRPVSCLCLLKLQLKHWSSIHQNKD